MLTSLKWAALALSMALILSACATSPARDPVAVTLPPAPASMVRQVPFPTVEPGVDARELNARLAAALATANGRIGAFDGWYAALIRSYADAAK